MRSIGLVGVSEPEQLAGLLERRGHGLHVGGVDDVQHEADSRTPAEEAEAAA